MNKNAMQSMRLRKRTNKPSFQSEKTAHLLTVPQVAKMLAVSSSTVYSWANTGYLPVVVMGRGVKKPVVRFRREAIERWIAQREKEFKDSIDKVNLEKEDFRKKVAHLTRKLDG